MDVGETSPASNPLHALGGTTLDRLEDGNHKPWYHPFPNPTVLRILYWKYHGSNLKSDAEIDKFIQDILRHPDFRQEHLQDFTTIAGAEARFDEYCKTEDNFASRDGWHEGSVKVKLPKEGVKYRSEDAVPDFEVKGLHYRRLIDVIHTAYEDPSQKTFHVIPHRLYHLASLATDYSTSPDEVESPNDPEANPFSNGIPPEAERLYSETYNSNAMLEEDAKIRAMLRNPDDSPDVEYALAPLLLWSDSTHLASFGTASLWPIYVFFGGVSKYERCKPTSFAANHLAYLPSVSVIFDLHDGLLLITRLF